MKALGKYMLGTGIVAWQVDKLEVRYDNIGRSQDKIQMERLTALVAGQLTKYSGVQAQIQASQ